jgi:hypothetical protein
VQRSQKLKHKPMNEWAATRLLSGREECPRLCPRLYGGNAAVFWLCSRISETAREARTSLSRRMIRTQRRRRC